MPLYINMKHLLFSTFVTLKLVNLLNTTNVENKNFIIIINNNIPLRRNNFSDVKNSGLFLNSFFLEMLELHLREKNKIKVHKNSLSLQ